VLTTAGMQEVQCAERVFYLNQQQLEALHRDPQNNRLQVGWRRSSAARTHATTARSQSLHGDAAAAAWRRLGCSVGRPSMLKGAPSRLGAA
jgi:hypothetical protein